MTLEDMREIIRKRVFVDGRQTRIITAGGATRRSPWLFDFRAVVLDSDWLHAYAAHFWDRFADRYPFQVGGLETASIPLIAAIVFEGKSRGMPVTGFYMRKSRDKDGLMKTIEGTLNEHPIILVDDIINSGGSFNRQILVLGEYHKTVTDIFAILAFRSNDAYSFAHSNRIRVTSLFTLTDFGMPLLSPSSPLLPAELFDEVWKFTAPNPSFEHVLQKSAPCIDEHNVYFGSDDGTFYALSQKTGEVVWKFSIGKFPEDKGIFSSPAVYNGIVYFGGYDGVLYALSAKTGGKIWTYEEADWIGSSPALAPDLGLVFIGLEFGLIRKRGGIAALDMKTGKRQWLDRTSMQTHCSPLYIPEENLVVIGSNDSGVYAYDARTGERKWVYQARGHIKTRASYDPIRRLILVPSMDERLYAFSHTGEPIFAFRTKAGIYSIPLVHGNVVYVASLDKTLYCIDLESGKKVWEFETAGRIFASPVIVGDSLCIGSNDGRLYKLDPTTGAHKGFHQFTERIVNAIVHNAETRCFFIPTIANEMYCLRTDAAA